MLASKRAVAVAALLACASHAPAPHATTTSQDIRGGLAVLCASRWNGEIYGNGVLRWLPDEIHDAITNAEVTKLVNALASPLRDRAGMFDAFVSENRVALGACPFRERLASWPPSLPIIAANHAADDAAGDGGIDAAEQCVPRQPGGWTVASGKAQNDIASPAGLESPLTCAFPPNATADDAIAKVELDIEESGAVLSARVVHDPGCGFAVVARECALAGHYRAARDTSGKPVRSRITINVRFSR